MRGMGRVGGEKVGGRFNQNTINACMKFSSHKLKLRGEKVYCNLVAVHTYSMSKLLAYIFLNPCLLRHVN